MASTTFSFCVAAMMLLQVFTLTEARLFPASVVTTVPKDTSSSAFAVRVSNGYIVDSSGTQGRYVGVMTSQLQQNVIEDMFPPVNKTAEEFTSLFNSSSVLRYFELNGTYHADVPLMLPSMTVLKVNGVVEDAKNATSTSEHPALIGLVNVSFSAVLGGTFLSRSSGFEAIRIEGSFKCAIRGVNAQANASSSIISIVQGNRNEVSGSEVHGGPGRCIWALATEQALVHGNHVHHCRAHALDFDAYTSYSSAWSNVCEHNGEEGIFVEETAHNNMIFNNTCQYNGNGIGVYSNAVGPVASNMFVGNILRNNTGSGLSVGGYGHNPLKHSENNIFAANIITGNAEPVDVEHGSAIRDFYISNKNEDGWSRVPESSANVTIFDP